MVLFNKLKSLFTDELLGCLGICFKIMVGVVDENIDEISLLISG